MGPVIESVFYNNPPSINLNSFPVRDTNIIPRLIVSTINDQQHTVQYSTVLLQYSAVGLESLQAVQQYLNLYLNLARSMFGGTLGDLTPNGGSRRIFPFEGRKSHNPHRIVGRKFIFVKNFKDEFKGFTHSSVWNNASCRVIPRWGKVLLNCFRPAQFELVVFTLVLMTWRISGRRACQRKEYIWIGRDPFTEHVAIFCH